MSFTSESFSGAAEAPIGFAQQRERTEGLGVLIDCHDGVFEAADLDRVLVV
jgi:hypothetical protein